MLSPAWNGSFFEKLEEELPESTFYWLFIALTLAITWVVYITYYNSRVLGLVLTMVANKFWLKNWGHVKFGELLRSKSTIDNAIKCERKFLLFFELALCNLQHRCTITIYYFSTLEI